MEALQNAIKKLIEDTANEVAEIVQEEHPKILAGLAKEIFDSVGQAHGRNWESNKPSTIKKKKFDRRNYETGELMRTLTTPGELENDNYIDALPTKYQYANKVNSPNNKFDDIGRTDEDDAYISDKLAEKITARFDGKE